MTEKKTTASTQAEIAPTEEQNIKIYRPAVTDYKLKMLVYGPPGVGKTSLLATANLHPLTAPILIINVEGGMLSIADCEAIGLKQPPDVVDLKEFDELEQVFWFLAKGKHRYRSVGIDSLSELQLVNLEGIVKKQLGRMSGSGARRESLDDVWQEDYGTSTLQLRRMVRQFRDLPLHVFFTCHDVASQDKDRNEIVAPMLTPKLRTTVMGYMDIIAYMYMDMDSEREGEAVRRALCRPYGKWLAKDRSPGQRLGLVLDNPSVPTIINKIIGKEE